MRHSTARHSLRVGAIGHQETVGCVSRFLGPDGQLHAGEKKPASFPQVGHASIG
jgi:hypothetical protein